MHALALDRLFFARACVCMRVYVCVCQVLIDTDTDVGRTRCFLGVSLSELGANISGKEGPGLSKTDAPLQEMVKTL